MIADPSRERMITAGQAPAGKFERLSFARLLARFWERGFTGSFRARTQTRPGQFVTKEILLERGKVAWAASDSPAESIRAFLLSRGLLSADQWRLAEEKSAGSQTRQVLLDLGFLSARELKTADRERVTSIVLDLFAWKEGEFAADPGPLPPGTPVLKIDPRDLVLEGLMASGDRERVLEEIGSLETVFVVRPDDLARASLSIPVEMAELMARADGTRTVAEICSLSPLPDFLISAAMAALKILGLAQPADGERSVAPPAPPRPAPSSGRTRPRKRGDGPANLEPRLPYEEAGVSTSDPETPSSDGAPSEESVMEAATVRFDPSVRPAPQPGAARDEEASPETLPLPPASSSIEGDEQTRPGAVKRTTDSGKVIWVSELLAEDEEPDPLWNVVTPPKVKAAKPLTGEERNSLGMAPAASPGDPSPEIDSLIGETELKAGIPVNPPPSPLEARSSSTLGASEIEDVIGKLGGEETAGTPPASPGDEAAQPRTIETPYEEDAETMESSGRGPFDEEPIEGLDEQPEPVGSAADPMWQTSEEDAGPVDEDLHAPGGEPDWVYTPSGGAMAGGQGGSPWLRWAGIAGAMMVLMVAVAILMGGRSDAVHEDSVDASEPGGPPPVSPPAASVDEESPVEPEAAAEEPQPPSAVARQAAPVQEPPARPAAKAPAREIRVASAGTETRLASPNQGDIFQSAPFQEGRAFLEKGKLREAAGSFAAAWSSHKDGYTLQLALACEPKTVTRALGSAGASKQFFILPKQYKGRSCYRLLWGGFPDRDSALRGLPAIPKAFREGGNSPFPAPI